MNLTPAETISIEVARRVAGWEVTTEDPQMESGQERVVVRRPDPFRDGAKILVGYIRGGLGTQDEPVWRPAERQEQADRLLAELGFDYNLWRIGGRYAASVLRDRLVGEARDTTPGMALCVAMLEWKRNPKKAGETKSRKDMIEGGD